MLQELADRLPLAQVEPGMPRHTLNGGAAGFAPGVRVVGCGEETGFGQGVEDGSASAVICGLIMLATVFVLLWTERNGRIPTEEPEMMATA